MPRKAQPVPPIFQPEVIVEAVYWLAHHNRRELWIGGSTVRAILGAKLAPWLAQWDLARMGYESQMRDERRDPNQPDNLFEPADAGKDYGAHGAFDTRSIEKSYETWTAEHKGVVAAATAGAGAGAAAIGFAATLALFGRRA